MGRDLGGLGEQRGVVPAEHLGAEAHRRIDLRLPEWPICRPGATQSFEQRLGAGVEMLLQLAMSARRHLADGKLARIVATGADQLDQRLGVGDVARVERAAGRDLAGRPRPQQAPHAARCRLDLGLQQARNLGANGGEPAAPGRVDRKIELGAQTAGAVVEAFEQRRHRNPAAAPEVGLELTDHPLDLGEHDHDGRSIRRGGDARRIVALRRFDGEPDQLPGRLQPAHHQHERIGQDVGLPRDRRIEHRLHGIEVGVGEIADMAREAVGDQRQHVPRLEQVAQLAHVVERLGGADLAGKPPACLVVGLGSGEHVADAVDHTVLEVAAEPLASCGAIREERAADLFGEGLRLRRQEIAADPRPDRLERDPRDATLMLVRSRIVDQERLDRPEEQAGGIANARRGNARTRAPPGAPLAARNRRRGLPRRAAMRVRVPRSAERALLAKAAGDIAVIVRRAAHPRPSPHPRGKIECRQGVLIAPRA